MTVGILRPTVITSQKNRSQNPKRIGIPKEYIKGKILLSLQDKVAIIPIGLTRLPQCSMLLKGYMCLNVETY